MGARRWAHSHRWSPPALAITAERSAGACYGWLFPLGRAGNVPLVTHKVTSSRKINNGLCTTQPHARGPSPRPRRSDGGDRESHRGGRPWLCCSIRALCTEGKRCRATTHRERGSFCTIPQCHHVPAGLSGGSTGGSVPICAHQPLLLPGPCLKPFLSPLISALCAASWPHPPTHIKATPAFLLILSFIIHFKSELIRGIKGPFSISSRALLSQPWPGLAGRAQQLSQDTDAKFQETESQNGALFLCKLPARLR